MGAGRPRPVALGSTTVVAEERDATVLLAHPARTAAVRIRERERDAAAVRLVGDLHAERARHDLRAVRVADRDVIAEAPVRQPRAVGHLVLEHGPVAAIEVGVLGHQIGAFAPAT